MADAVTSQKLVDGPDKLVMLFTNVSDGTGEAAVTKIDVSTLAQNDGRPCVDVAIEELRYSTDGMSVRILWDADTDDVGWLIPPDRDGKQCFDVPLKNPRSTGWTGDVKFTTVGHTAGDTYSIYLVARKRFG